MSSNVEPAIEVEDLRVRRGGNAVLPGISLRVGRGVELGARLAFDAGIVGGCVGIALVLGAATLRRRTP